MEHIQLHSHICHRKGPLNIPVRATSDQLGQEQKPVRDWSSKKYFTCKADLRTESMSFWNLSPEYGHYVQLRIMGSLV